MKSKIFNIVLATAMLLTALLLLGGATVVAEGIRGALLVCFNTLIPALFPFMVLCGFISRSECGKVLAKPFGFLWRYVFKVPQEAGTVIMLSMIGGYPVGAKGIANLLERRVIDKETAERMLCFCVNCGPSFLITAVGTGLLFNKTAGIILLATQTFTSLLIGAIISIGKTAKESSSKTIPPETSGVAFVSAVSAAVSSMLLVCAFAVLFAGLLAVAGETLILRQGIAETVLAGFLEVTSGCVTAAKLGGETAFALISLCVSFGGLSVIFQVASCFSSEKISLTPFIISRLLHMPIACAIAMPLWRHFCQTVTVALITPYIMQTTEQTWLLTICLIGMCTILLTNLNTTRELHNFHIWNKIKKTSRQGSGGVTWK